jgi:AraC-like DNA-binding protein
MTSSGASFTERVNELRLQRAFALLIEPNGNGQRISDIALEVGFSDISHFNRVFRARFGISPRSVRSAGRVMSERDPDPSGTRCAPRS